MSARFAFLGFAMMFVAGWIVSDAYTAHTTPDPHVCARIEAVMSDPESSASRGPHAADELEQAWNDAGCAEVGK